MACHRSSSQRERGTACSRWDSRTWCVLGSWNEGPSRDWAWWRLDGCGAGRPRCKEGEWGEGPSPAITTMFCSFAYVFRLSVSMRKVAGEHPFCVLIHMNSYVFHIYFTEFISLSYVIFDFVYLTLSLMIFHTQYNQTYLNYMYSLSWLFVWHPPPVRFSLVCPRWHTWTHLIKNSVINLTLHVVFTFWTQLSPHCFREWATVAFIFPRLCSWEREDLRNRIIIAEMNWNK